jgi:hypothetical protein
VGDRWVWYSSGGIARLWTSGDKLFVTPDGHLGVGAVVPQQSLSVDRGLNVDQANVNNGAWTPGLSFGSGSGEVIASKRTAGGNQYGLDFYTAFTNRMVITNAGNVGIGTTTPSVLLDVGGWLHADNLSVTGFKFFVIDHPLDAEHRHLVHASLEGPEAAVFYRGEGELKDGRAIVHLPAYFQALTRGRACTVLLTAKATGEGPASPVAASEVRSGRFAVRAIGDDNPSQAFYWEVKAARADVEGFEAEPEKPWRRQKRGGR